MEKDSRRKCTFNILGRIEDEKKKRGWSDYQLSVQSGVSQAILTTWKKKSLTPSLASIEQICDAFGITLSQFFNEGETVRVLSNEEAQLVDLWEKTSMKQKETILQMMDAFVHNK